MIDALERLAALGPEQRAELERRLRAARKDRTAPPAAVETAPVPLSPGQQRMWFLDQLGPKFPAYVIVAGWRVQGDLDRGALTAAFRAVVERHPILRTVITEVEGEPRQQVRPLTGEPPVSFADLSGLPSEDWQLRLQRIVGEESQRRFDLATGPLIRMRVLRMGPQDHRLLLAAHHIALDGWSLSLVVSDLLYAYAGDTREPLPVGYADFVTRLDEAGLTRQLEYWRQALDGMPQSLELPADRQRPAKPTYRGGRVTFWLDQDLTADLHALARAENATLFTVLLAGWQALLSRYTGATDVPVGTPISIRPDADFDGVAGLFLNTLVLRGDVSGDPDFRTLLSRTTECAFAGYENRDYPFERLVDKLADSRDLHGNPLFQVMIVLQNTPAPLTTAGGLRLVPLDLAPETAKFDLNLQLTEVDGRLRGDLDYAAELFDADRVWRIAGHFRQLLAGAVADPGLPVSTLPLLTLDEQALLDSWNRTSTPAPYESLPSRFAAAAAAFPNRPAVGTEEEWLDYREFADRVAGLASYLVAHGVRGGTVVGVCLPRGIDLVVALHAVHAAGGAYLPLDVDYPDARLQFMVSDARAAIVLTDDQHAATYAGSTATVLRPRPTNPPVFGADAVLQPDIGAKNREVAAAAAVPEPDELAYVIYTSGSTGKPKGVGVSHRAIANRISWMQRHFPLDGTDRVLQKTPASFDVSVWEFFWPLTVGASVLVAAPDGHRDSGYLARVIGKERVTTVHFVPSMLDAFVDEPELPQGLRRVFCSGEALPAELAGRCLDALPGTELHNLYGPTEAAVDVTWQPVRGLDLHRGVPIGKPVPNTTIEILDRHLARVPVGVPGELCIGGVQLARGYLGRPGLTADRFVPGPSGSRWYRTGDLARWRSDGRLEYLGRLDHQVKVRGVRIELGEIEAALVEQPEVRAAVVLVREGRLVAYLVADLSGRDSARVTSRWSERLRERLPSPMIPDRYVLLDRLPVTANGKLDRSALASPPRVVVDGEPPKSGTETLVAGIWQDVLGCERVSADDDFFAVGGDSIRSLKVVSRLRTAGFTVALADLFRFRTVRDLAARLDAAGHDPGEPAHPTEAFGLLDPADRARLLGGAS